MRVDVSLPGAEHPELPIDPAGYLLRAAAEPSPVRRRSAVRMVVSNSNSSVIEATLLLGRAIEEGRLAVSADDRDLLVGAAHGFMEPSAQRTFMGDHLAEQAIKLLRTIIMHRHLETVDALAHERAWKAGEVERDAVAAAEDNPNYGIF